MSDLRDRVQAALGDQYEIVRELGGGGMSHVLLAIEKRLDREVVIKLLPPDLLGGASLERFHREIQLVAKLQHPLLVPVLTVGDVDGAPFYTMPYVAGRSLRAQLDEGTRFGARDAVRVLRDVATALGYAHERGIVHRDIKPDNVLLSGGVAMVTDFGIAKAITSAREPALPGAGTLTLLGTSLGTPMYMAPEQVAADPATDYRADLYSFGAMAYELFTGAPPFAGRAPAALIAAQMSEVPPLVSTARPDAPAALVEIVRRCLEKDPARRPQSASEVVDALDVALAEDGSSTGVRASGIARATATRRPRRAWIIGGIAAAAVIALAAAIVVGTRGSHSVASRATPSVKSPSGASATTVARSVAVLPFENMGGGDDDRYFSEGMTDELTSALSKVPGLRVASRSSVFALTKRGLSAQEVANTLNVSHVLEGTVRRSGGRLRVSTQLTNAADGLALWGDTYERQMRDVFQVQDEITGSIVSALRLRLAAGTATQQRRGESGTTNLDAYDAYLKGRYFWYQRGADALHRAAGYFERAIALDPSYARAHAGLADALALLPVYGATPADSAYPLARREAERALALDSSLAEAHTTLGLILKSAGQWEPSARAFAHALALDSTYAPAHQWYGETLLITGRVREAVTQLRRAEALEPLSPVISAELGYALALAGDHAGGVAAGRRAIELDSTAWTGSAFLALVYLFHDDAGSALPLALRAVQLAPNVDPLKGILAYAQAKAGHADSARALVTELEAHQRQRGGALTALAMAHAGLGDTSESLTWLERAAREHDAWLYAMSINAPIYAALRNDPRFAGVARTMGLDPAAMTTSPR